MGVSGSVFREVSAPFSWVLVCTRFCWCPPRVCSPVLYKFWWFYGGVHGDLLQEGLSYTQVCCIRPCSRLTRTSTGDTDTVLAQSLWVGCAFVPFPGLSSTGDKVLSEHIVPDGPCVLITSLSRLLGFPGALQEHHLRCAICLFRRVDLRLRPSWRMSTIQDLRKMWLASGSLLTVW